MTRLRLPVRLFAALVTLAIATGCGDSSSPTSPSSATPAAATRIIGIAGNLAFGDVSVGGAAERTMTVTNTGSSPLTVSGMTVTGGLANFVTASWTRGVIAAGASQNVLLRVEPSSSGSYSGTVAIDGDQTAGANTIPISVNAVGFSAAGTFQGRYVVERCDGTGSIQDLLCSANRGLYPVGASLPIRLILTQAGSSVSGRVEFGQVTGNVQGAVSPGGTLSLQGTATNSDLTITITNWNTPIVGNSLTGTIGVNIGSRSIFGVAAITARLSEVRR